MWIRIRILYEPAGGAAFLAAASASFAVTTKAFLSGPDWFRQEFSLARALTT